eukprot:TRINITY_DN2305_c0_g1_i2.p1 TRINITY_DN2305_c0_g1~~TRINITY_DN2305_c0_g1_i2.p1  ORF type:complete len:379 (-),score=125.16 TRINITY_DN2305_c0_g1_i2:242-1378(-)
MAEKFDLSHISDSTAHLQPLPFILKLYQILSTPAYNAYVSWGSQGLSVLVRDSESFCTHVLPKHFKHNNFGSFARQLNIYGFRKVGDGEFKHEMFVRAAPHLLGRIRRRASKFKQQRAASGVLPSDVSMHVDAEALSVGAGSRWPSSPLPLAAGSSFEPLELPLTCIDTADPDHQLPLPLPVALPSATYTDAVASVHLLGSTSLPLQAGPTPPSMCESPMSASPTSVSVPSCAGAAAGGDELHRLRELNALLSGQIDRLQRAYEATQGSVSIMLDIVTRSVRDQQQMESRVAAMSQQLADCKASLSLLLGSRVQDEPPAAAAAPWDADASRLVPEVTAAELSMQIQKDFRDQQYFSTTAEGPDEVFSFFSSLGAADIR